MKNSIKHGLEAQALNTPPKRGNSNSINELADLRRRIAQLEASAAEHKQMKEALRKSEKRTTELLTANAILTEQIAERKQMERELVRTERLRALGEMARGVAHNFNSLLVGVLGYAQLIEIKTSDPESAREAANITESALRARELVERLNRSVQSEEEGTPHPVPVNEVVQEAVQVAQPRWRDEPEARGVSVQVLTELEEVPPVAGTQSWLHDILINLLLNAVDALPEGGTVTIGTEAVDRDVRLTVKDTGIGMDEETRTRVFEPFFTTKADVGTGLGLSTVHGIVTRWGGNVEVESTLGRGTTVTLRIPAWRDPDVEAKEEVDLEICPVRRAKVLIVEDDQDVGSLFTSVLSANHDVQLVLSGQEALAGFTPGRYDVALIDLGMPGMSGDQVAREMRQSDPLVSTVLVTGWRLGENDPRLSAFDFLLLKPASPHEVRHVAARAVELHDTRAAKRG